MIFIRFSRYFIALLFGLSVASSFAGMKITKKNSAVVVGFAVCVFIVQLCCLFRFGMDITMKLYPLICHVPIALFLVYYLKCSWLIAITNTFVSFLCCQPPRWIGSVLGGALHNGSFNHLGYIVTAMILFYFLYQYVAESVQALINRSIRSCLLFGAVPAFYYFYDYGSTVYTDLIYSGSPVVYQFIPFVTTAFYFVFILYYYAETQKQALIQRDRDIFEIQYKQAQIEIASLRQIHENAKTYRHDMRHHFALLQGLSAKGRMEEIKEYLQTAQSDIDAITPVRFCENETVNLILSAFSTKAKAAGINFTADVKLPELILFSDTEICSLLSNALENAINACEKILDSTQRHIKLYMYPKNNKLCMDIRNTYQIEPTLRNGMPVSEETGHGYGTKSMTHIIEKYGGICRFVVKDGWFIFQATT